MLLLQELERHHCLLLVLRPFYLAGVTLNFDLQQVHQRLLQWRTLNIIVAELVEVQLLKQVWVKRVLKVVAQVQRFVVLRFLADLFEVDLVQNVECKLDWRRNRLGYLVCTEHLVNLL